MSLLDNPKFLAFIKDFEKLMQSTEKLSLDEARKQSTAFFCPPELKKEKVFNIHDVKIKGREGNDIPIRIYNPAPIANLPIFIYYHRGGWVFGNIEEADSICRKFANHLGCIVASVDYRLAPENPFPKPLNDCYDAFLWIAKHAKELGGSKDALVVGGESAGGNLAASVSLQARDKNGPSIAIQLLIYPVISSTLNENAYENSADKYFLTKEAMQFFLSMYLPNKGDEKSCYSSPDLAPSLEGLPKTIIITAEHDPLHEEGEAYGRLLAEAGNLVSVKRFDGVIHGFLDLPIYSEEEVISHIKKIREQFSKLLTTEKA